MCEDIATTVKIYLQFHTFSNIVDRYLMNADLGYEGVYGTMLCSNRDFMESVLPLILGGGSVTVHETVLVYGYTGKFYRTLYWGRQLVTYMWRQTVLRAP